MKTEKKKTLRGSALFTVVAVMAILILFLTGTLMLATASNRRAHKSYSISQASYTAKAAIRSFKAALEDPTNGSGIAAALYSLNPSDPDDILEPQILMGENAMGRIGYWGDDGVWRENCIKIEPVPGRVDWVYDPASDEWLPYNVVLVTSTCRLGREEETVHAFISRNTEISEGEAPVSDSEVKGLQEAGGNTFMNGGDIYGGLGIALADDPSDGLGEYELNNSFQTHTTLNFINANVYMLTSSFKVNVEKSTTTPVSGTVIMGNLSIKNNSFITLKNSYKMERNYRQKDIPYLYVDKLIYERQGTSSPYVEPEDGMESSVFQPFNIYAGTMYYPEQFMSKADLYLMDSPSSEMYDAPYATMLNGGASNENTKLKRGDSYYGCDANGNTSTTGRQSKQLYKWASSTFTRKDTYDMFGGNIICNGNFHFGSGIIHGDVRVQGDFYLEDVASDGDRPIIEGNLIVAGTIHDNAHYNVDDVVQGIIYNTGLASEGATVTITLKDGYEKVENALIPGYSEVENAELDNRLLVEGTEVRKDADDKYWVIIADLGDQRFDTIPYIETVPLSDSTYGDSDPAVITTDPKTRYEVDKDGKFAFDDDGNPIKTTEQYVYFDDEGNPCSSSDAKGTYYIRSGVPDVMVPFSEANNVSSGSSKAVPYEQYVENFGRAYPENMTREKIYGEYQDGKFITHPETKLVTTLDDARRALSWNKTDGAFDKSAYPYEDITFDEAHADHVISGSLTSDLTITRPADGFEWYVLDDLNINGGCNIYIEDAPGTVHIGNKQFGGGVVRFLIKGNLTMNGNSRICLKNMPSTINYTYDFGIEYYGYAEEDDAGSVVGKARITNNNGNLIVGSIKAPYMELDSKKGEGPDSFTYVPESGDSVSNYKPIIIGNALINKIQHYDWTGENIDPWGNMNGFNLAYTKSGTGSTRTSDEHEGSETTGDGDWLFTYFTS